ncbi:hypothetical protein Tco_1258367 [Tanacetum coccineum]
MNPQETQQVTARDEKWVPSAERVKISSTNIRLETTVTDIHKKTKTRPKSDKTKHRIGKSMENRSQRYVHLGGPTQPKLMGQVSLLNF